MATLLILIGLSGAAPAADVPVQKGRLFDADTVLDVTLSADFSALLEDRDEQTSDFRPGSLAITDDTGQSRRIAVTVKTRGVFRLARGNCHFPQLFVRFVEDPIGTLFAGQHMVPLTAHCKTSRYYEQYVLQEQLAYQTYRLLTDRALRTRLARVRYVDTSGKRDELTRYAFFTEHFEHLARRLGCQIVTVADFDPRDADPYEAGLMDVFQYMIGNTDWSTVHQHNVLLLKCPPDRITPVPYDLDWSGVVDARYAYPGAEVNINSVRQRVYRGICRPSVTFDEIFAHVTVRKPAIYALYRDQPGLERKVLKRTLTYYDEFYETLATPKRLRKYILDACYRIAGTDAGR